MGTTKAKESFNSHLKGFNKEGIGYLRQNSPEVKRLESLEGIEDLRFIRGTEVYEDLLLLEYQARAPSLFPAVRQRLIERGVGGRHNMLHTAERDGKYNVTMGFYGSRLQISVDFSK